MLYYFTIDGFDSLHPHFAGGRPPETQHRAVRADQKARPRTRPASYGLPFSAWSLPKLADYLMAQGWLKRYPMRDLARCCAKRMFPFQRLKTWKASNDQNNEAKA